MKPDRAELAGAIVAAQFRGGMSGLDAEEKADAILANWPGPEAISLSGARIEGWPDPEPVTVDEAISYAERLAAELGRALAFIRDELHQ
jgi:hypothetical protein